MIGWLTSIAANILGSAIGSMVTLYVRDRVIADTAKKIQKASRQQGLMSDQEFLEAIRGVHHQKVYEVFKEFLDRLNKVSDRPISAQQAWIPFLVTAEKFKNQIDHG